MHWTERYIGRPHSKSTYNCASLAIDVQREVFNQIVVLPVESMNYSYRVLSGFIDEYKESVAQKVETPIEGDAVLMFTNSRLNHIGVYTIINDTPYVLHNMQRAGTCLHKLRDIGTGALANISVEGYYRFRTPE
jgi:hypothetical protein